MGRGKKPATSEDIEALPPGWVGELIDGELYAFWWFVEVYRRGARGWRLSRHSGEVRVHAEPFDAEPLDLERLWAPGAAPAPVPGP